MGQVEDTALAIVKVAEQQLQPYDPERYITCRHYEFWRSPRAPRCIPETVEKPLRFLQMLDDIEDQHVIEITQVHVQRLCLVPNPKVLERIRLCGQELVQANHATALLDKLSCETA